MCDPMASTLDLGNGLAMALSAVSSGAEVGAGISARQDIPKGHKVALKDYAEGDVILKFGQPIGITTTPIGAGDWIHSHNLAFQADMTGYETEIAAPTPEPLEDFDPHFMGYHRPDGRVGTRNFVGIISTVNCSSHVCRQVAERANAELLELFPNIDGFVPITHRSGCGMAGHGDAFALLQRTLNGYLSHPNFGAVMVIGLGCEVNQVMAYRLTHGEAETRPVMTVQQVGGTQQTIDLALQKLRLLCEKLEQGERRQKAGLEHLLVGLQCGGSDGLSGVTANPALGRAVDLLVAKGGSAILSETPEIFGAEHLLTARSSPEVASEIMDCVKWWRDHTEQFGVSVDNNPSPGNKAGGLTTILEKSLGAISKSGTSPIMAFYPYAEKVIEKGLVFMDSPGYDPASATGQIAGGANLIVFTTGRGSCFGSRPAPCLKLASSTTLYQHMQDDMDINCGVIADGTVSLDNLGRQILKVIIDCASGKPSKSELFGYGNDEFVPWQYGPTL